MFASFFPSDFWSRKKFQYCAQNNRYLHFLVVAYHFLDVDVPMLADFVKLGHITSSNGRLYPELYGEVFIVYPRFQSLMMKQTWYAWVALLNVLSDAAIVILPVPLVWNLQIPTKRKVATTCILLTGGV